MKILLIMMMATVGCGGDTRPKDEQETDVIDVVLDEKADAGRWKVRASETSVWFDTRIVAADDGTFNVGGRVSRNILSLTGELQDGSPIAVKQVSARKFQIRFDETQLISLARGERIFVEFETHVGTVTGMALYAPRLGSFDGDAEVFVLTSFNPILVGDQERLRGRLSLPTGWSLDVATTDIGWEGIVGYDPVLWRFDFPIEAVPFLVDNAPVLFHASDVEAQTLTKAATLRFRLVQIGATSDDPADVWPEDPCRDEVVECLSDAPIDTEVCGYLNQVSACLPVHAHQFSADLKMAISEYYERHSQQIRVSEGRTLEDAIENVSPYRVRDVEPFEVGGFQTDIRAAQIVYHPGVIFRDSPHIWYGAYSRDGELLEIRLVNDILD